MDEKSLYVFYCNKCNYKRFSNGNDIGDLLQVKQSPIPRHIPKYDEANKITVNWPEKKRNKIFKCPKCGFTIKPHKVENQVKVEKKNEQTDKFDGC